MRNMVFVLILFSLIGCSATIQYSWQDVREPARDDVSVDLEECRTYAARQYKPGMPAGEPYLLNEKSDEETQNSEGGDAVGHAKKSEWRPDRDPFHTTNINTQPIHDVPVDYTGYPGELDYHPGYLDAILEKCMYDRGWRYEPMLEEKEDKSM